MTNAEARFNNSLPPRKPEGSLGRTAQDVHLDSHTAPELCNEAGAGQFMTDFLPLTAWSQVPPVSLLKWSTCGSIFGSGHEVTGTKGE